MAPEWLDVVVLLATELVTNAILHANTDVEIRYELEQDSVLVEVADGSSRPPRVLRAPGDEAAAGEGTSGRGMCIVEALSAEWGSAKRLGGKAVWFRLPRW